MKVLTAIISTLLMIHSLSTAGANGPVHLYINGHIIEAKQLEKGAINYYSSMQYEDNVIQSEPVSFFEKEQIRVQRYFIGTENALEEITSYNYKELIRKYLPNAPDLHKRLGKKGFRFENIRYMIRFYNKFRA